MLLAYFVRVLRVELARGCGQLGGEGVEGERAEQVAAEAALHLVEAAGRVLDPGEVEDGVEAV
jgi:hypothetical protein